MQKELELKFLNVNKKLIRKKLAVIGAELIFSETLTRQKTFDFINLDLKPGEYKWARVREINGKSKITLKHLVDDTKIDGINEWEVGVDDFESACDLIIGFGLTETNYQEKYREMWKIDNVEVVIDTWPGLNPYIEIEGPSEEVVYSVSEMLGFDKINAVLGSADYVFQKELGVPLGALQNIKTLTFDGFKEELREWVKPSFKN